MRDETIFGDQLCYLKTILKADESNGESILQKLPGQCLLLKSFAFCVGSTSKASNPEARARKVIADVVKPSYKDLRDLNKFVSWLLRTHTYVTRRADTLFVEFAPQRSKNMGAALEALCTFLTASPPLISISASPR
jgi:hypothetical protein